VTAVFGDAHGVLPRAHALLTAWRELVTEVEEGYGWCAPELLHDLGCRSGLAAVWRRLPEEVRAARQAELDALDERFRTATIPHPGRQEDTGHWWTRRVPRTLCAEPGEGRVRGWPPGWDMMPFAKPDEVDVVE
jgi:hypothetical protein